MPKKSENSKVYYVEKIIGRRTRFNKVKRIHFVSNHDPKSELNLKLMRISYQLNKIKLTQIVYLYR